MAKEKHYLTENAKLMAEWDWEKNEKSPDQYTLGSGQEAWWICPLGHSYKMRVSHRTGPQKCGCPICTGKQVLVGFNDLATINPDLAKEWHPTKNIDLLPTMVTASSNKKVWWQCKNGHEWQTTVNERTRGRGCPICSGKKVLVGFNDLATINPELAKEWHPTKNIDLLPTMVTAGSNKKVWWKCSKGHEWQAKICNRAVLDRSCPFCSNQKVLIGFNDLVSSCPELVKEWNYEKNDKNPEDYTKYSVAKVWWLGKCGHEWKASIAHRVNGTGCPICSKGIQTSFPEQAVYYYVKQANPDAINGFKGIFDNGMELDIFIPSVKIGIEYDGIAYHKTKKAYEKEKRKYEMCKSHAIKLIRVKENQKHAHWDTFDILIHSKYDNSNYNDLDYVISELSKYINLPKDIDTKRDKLIIQEQYLQALKNQSLLTTNPELAKEWHPKKNGKLFPNMFKAGSMQKVWWICKNGHEWQAPIGNRSKGVGCPYCSGKSVLKGFNDLETKCPTLAMQWHPTKNGNLLPSMFTVGSNKKVWWQCEKNHEWQATIASRSHGNGCPYCSNRSVLKGFNDLGTTNPKLSNQWHPTKNGDLLPSMVTAGSTKKVWWKCNNGHEWQATINDRSSGRGCPYCSGKKVLYGYNDLLTINPELAKEWHQERNGEIKPNMVTVGSGRIVWWKCSKCGYEWQKMVKDRNNGSGCPNCKKSKRKDKEQNNNGQQL